MTSILTNTAAMSALSTLRSISGQMDETQARVSSGLRVGGASDNAAYWSIATTMRSDNMALSSVQDALGLGAAKVDTAYAGMNSAIEVVKEIKAKLVAATESGVDKAKIQEEITQLQDQLKGISESASFSGQNWLQADLSNGPVTKDVVASFVRTDTGLVSVKKATYELNSGTVLFDAAATNKQGILDKEATAGNAKPVLTDVQIVEEKISTKTADDLLKDNPGGYNATWSPDGGTTEMEAWVDSANQTYVRYMVGGVAGIDDNGKELWARVITLDPGTSDVDDAIADRSVGAGFTNGTLDYYYAEDNVSVTKSVVALTKDSLLSIAGSSVTGRVATAGGGTWIQLEADKDVWVKATTGAGNATDQWAGVDIGNVNYNIDQSSTTLPAALQGAELGFSVGKFDLADLEAIGEDLGAAAGEREAAALDFMIQYVDTALSNMTSAAANLGSISMRIDLQSEFVSKLSESIDAGVGRLVDADLNEESTRLKALQTQQQLAIQSLSIANNASQNVLSLFR